MAEDNYGFNTIAEWKYRFEVNGLVAARVQECNPGKAKIAVREHQGAGQNHPFPEPGGLTFDKLILKLVVPDTGSGGLYFYQWMTECQDAQSGNGMPISACFKNASLYEMNNAGINVRTTEFYYCFVTDDGTSNKVSNAWDKNVIDEIEIKYAYKIER